MDKPFKDHFSVAAGAYGRFRPGYPRELPEHLAAAAPGRERCWDCATGSGQAAALVAPWFDEVVATDASAEQIAHAVPLDGVRYAVATAERSGLPDASVDLVTVAQALHWFDLPSFYAEVRRVGRPGAVLAAWAYSLATVDATVDAVVNRFYQALAPWWPPERALVESGYATLPFPFEPVALPPLEMRAEWPLDHLLGYFGTWSAVNRCRRATGSDPLDALAAPLTAAWGDRTAPRTIRWPLHLRVGRLQ